MRIALSGIYLSLLLIGSAVAQTSAPAPTTAPAAAPAAAAPAAPSATDKKSISKSCTDQANAKGLHGKARKKFRSACKKNGGKAS
jgi:hypothetical protein